jgi:hypothetical protein
LQARTAGNAAAGCGIDADWINLSATQLVRHSLEANAEDLLAQVDELGRCYRVATTVQKPLLRSARNCRRGIRLGSAAKSCSAA